MEKIKPTNFSKIEIQKLAEDLHKQLDCYIPVNINLVISNFGGEVKYFHPKDLTKEQYEQRPSLRVFSRNEFYISIMDFMSVKNDNTSLCHDFAHYVLHSKCGELEVEAPRFGAGLAEYEANWFMWAFLMPRDIFLKSAFSYKKNTNNLSYKFSVPESIVQLRMKELEKDIADYQI